MFFLQSAERISRKSILDNYVFQRSLLAYKRAAELIHGKVLEIGTGSGYGIEEIAPNTTEFWTLDKHYINVNYKKYSNTRFIKSEVPPLANIPDNYFDFVICFQVIEHIKDAKTLLKEIKRVLKANGKLIVSTPNLNMSLTYNPWHIKEYSHEEFKDLLGGIFVNIDAQGVYGDSDIISYYNKNKKSVQGILKYDILNLNRNLPRWMLKIPYDLMNFFNRRLLFNRNKELTSRITINNYYFNSVSDECFDLFYIAEKQRLENNN
jgi:SAM-dependent methyltransferase